MTASATSPQSAREIRGTAPVVPLASEPPPRLIVDPPIAEALAKGRVYT